MYSGIKKEHLTCGFADVRSCRRDDGRWEVSKEALVGDDGGRDEVEDGLGG